MTSLLGGCLQGDHYTGPGTAVLLTWLHAHLTNLLQDPSLPSSLCSSHSGLLTASASSPCVVPPPCETLCPGLCVTGSSTSSWFAEQTGPHQPASPPYFPATQLPASPLFFSLDFPSPYCSELARRYFAQDVEGGRDGAVILLCGEVRVGNPAWLQPMPSATCLLGHLVTTEQQPGLRLLQPQLL